MDSKIQSFFHGHLSQQQRKLCDLFLHSLHSYGKVTGGALNYSFYHMINVLVGMVSSAFTEADRCSHFHTVKFAQNSFRIYIILGCML